MEVYEVIIKARDNPQRFSLMFSATDFAHVEEQALPYLDKNDEIVEILKDYDHEN